MWSRLQLARNFEVGKTVTNGRLQVDTITYKVGFKSNCHAKKCFAATTLVFGAAHMSARLN